MKLHLVRILAVMTSVALATSRLAAQQAAPSAAPAVDPSTLTYLTPPQQVVVVAMNAKLAPQVQARAAAQAALTEATFALPSNAANIRARVDALAAAQQELATARATAIGQIQASANRFTVAQLQDIMRATGDLPAKKRLLIWADTRNGQAQHDFTSHAMAIIERMGYESGLWDTYIRTDSDIVSYAPQKTTGGAASGGPSLGNVDAIFSLTHREAPMSDAQKADLLRFVRDEGKGFVTGHTGLTALTEWPEFREMIGGDFGGHNIGYPGTLVVEDPKFPGASAFPMRVNMQEEWYNLQNFSRDKIHVIMRLDLSIYPTLPASVANSGGDFPVAWARQYGKGRVFGSTFAHVTQTWDNPMIQTMYFEAIKWALKLTDADVTPRPLPPEAVLPKKQ